jgi:hypothetical protein
MSDPHVGDVAAKLSTELASLAPAALPVASLAQGVLPVASLAQEGRR